MRWIQFLALASLLVMVVARASFAWRRSPRARISWLGGLLGALAMLTLGAVVPQEWLDAPLGGSNLIKLVQGCLTVIAFWLTVQAGIAPRDARLRTLDWRLPLILVAVFTVTFLSISDRPATTYYFVEEGARFHTDIWLYGVVHMLGTAIVAVSLFRSARTHTSTTRLLFQAGAAAVVLACVSEIADLTLTRTGFPTPVVSALFDPLFYAGIVAVVIGIASLWMRTRVAERTSQSLISELVAIADARGTGSFLGDPGLLHGDAHVHSLRIAIEDAANASEIALTPREVDALRRADVHLSRGQSLVPAQ